MYPAYYYANIYRPTSRKNDQEITFLSVMLFQQSCVYFLKTFAISRSHGDIAHYVTAQAPIAFLA